MAADLQIAFSDEFIRAVVNDVILRRSHKESYPAHAAEIAIARAKRLRPRNYTEVIDMLELLMVELGEPRNAKHAA